MRSGIPGLIRHSLRAVYAAAFGIATVAQAQTPAVRSLGPPTATLKEQFSSVRSVRELSSGRALLSDSREERVVLVNFDSHTAQDIGRRGDGPGEFRRAGLLFATGGDSTLMPHMSALRWTVIDGRGGFSTLSSEHRLVSFFGLASPIGGTDRFGRVLTVREPPTRRRDGRDTSFLVLVSRATLRVDTIGRVDVGPADKAITLEEFEAKGSWFNVYANWDQYLLANDGWVAVVRRDPYRVDWRSPEGRWQLGPIVAERRVAVDERVKAEYLASRAPSTILVRYEWPATIPPFAGGGAFVTSSGEVLIQRTRRPATAAPIYDVFDRQGVRTYQLVLSRDRQILGFGAGTVYVVSTDAVGLQTVSRHRWPIP